MGEGGSELGVKVGNAAEAVVGDGHCDGGGRAAGVPGLVDSVMGSRDGAGVRGSDREAVLT